MFFFRLWIGRENLFQLINPQLAWLCLWELSMSPDVSFIAQVLNKCSVIRKSHWVVFWEPLANWHQAFFFFFFFLLLQYLCYGVFSPHFPASTCQSECASKTVAFLPLMNFLCGVLPARLFFFFSLLLFAWFPSHSPKTCRITGDSNWPVGVKVSVKRPFYSHRRHFDLHSSKSLGDKSTVLPLTFMMPKCTMLVPWNRILSALVTIYTNGFVMCQSEEGLLAIFQDLSSVLPDKQYKASMMKEN